MRWRPRAVLPSLVCLPLLLGPRIAGGQPSGSGAEEVTTDTPEYCLHLLDMVSDMVRRSVHPPPHEVTELSSQGQRMCDHGQTRGGILRLRRALLLMMQHPED